MQRSVRSFLVLGAVSTWLMALAPATVAEAPASDDVVTAFVVGGTQQADWQLTAAQLQDLALMAEQDGVTVADAIESFAWREPFSQLVNEIRAAHPDSFAGSGVTPGPDGSPWVAFEAAAPSSAVTLLAGFTKAVTVFEGRGFTEAELANLMTEIHYRIYGSPVAAEVSSGYDPVTGLIETAVVPRGSTADRIQIRARLLSLLTGAQRERLRLLVTNLEA